MAARGAGIAGNRVLSQLLEMQGANRESTLFGAALGKHQHWLMQLQREYPSLYEQNAKILEQYQPHRKITIEEAHNPAVLDAFFSKRRPSASTFFSKAEMSQKEESEFSLDDSDTFSLASE